MATRSRAHSRKDGTARRSEDAETNDVTATVPTGAKLDKSGLYDQQQVKRLLDDQLVATLEDIGYIEYVTVINLKIVLGSIAVALAIYSHFNGREYPENRPLIIGCVAGYGVCVALVSVVSWFMEGNAFFVGYRYLDEPSAGRASLEPKVWVYSTLGPKGSSTYTIELRRSARAKKPADYVKLCKPYEQYIFEDGELALAAFRKDVKHLIESLGKKSRKAA